ncbi:MAG: 2-oxoacid:acceptor oxidoreductase family protein [Acidilobaceae archaeon]
MSSIHLRDGVIGIRWHGRGGQGAVTGAIALAVAAVEEGLYAQAFPEFGAERRGAPVRAYNRISKKPIITRSVVSEPDVVIVLDSSLSPSVYLSGLKPGGWVIINSKQGARALVEKLNIDNVAVVDATGIALKFIKAPIVNTSMLGAVAKDLSFISLEALAKAIARIVFEVEVEDVESYLSSSQADPRVKANIEALREAYMRTEVISR